MRRPSLTIAIVAALGLVLTGCGGSDDDPAGAGIPATDQPALEDPAADEPAGDADIAPPEDAAEDPGEDPVAEGLGTAEAAIQRMRELDPSAMAAAHDGVAGSADRANSVHPERIVIPSIGVDADVIELGLQGDGTMEVPTDYAQTGWYQHGPRPGRVGPAVIAGHVSDRNGPAVFYRLGDLTAGDEIAVSDDDGTTVTFVVTDVQQHPKDDFPTDAVYGGTAGPELRLITCSGEFDAANRTHLDNTIVFAERRDTA